MQTIADHSDYHHFLVAKKIKSIFDWLDSWSTYLVQEFYYPFIISLWTIYKWINKTLQRIY